MKKLYLAAAAVLIAGTAGQASAQTTTIDFETGATSTFAFTTPLTTRYAAQGVTFSGVDGKGGSILNDSSFGLLDARSGTNFLAFNTAAGTGTSERLTFSSAISAFNIYLAANGGATFTATGFDANGLALATTAATTTAPGQYANLSLGGFNFSQVVFTGSASVFAADDLSFTAAAVPEPASWALMLVGFGVAGHALRRRRKVNTAVSFA